MGYYSEVGLTISAAGYKQLTGKLTTLEDSELRTVVENLLAHADTHYTSKEGDQLWFWNWTKWYSTFPEINWLQAQLNELDAQDFYFIRIGEEFDDVETDGSCCENPFEMEVSRGISMREAIEA